MPLKFINEVFQRYYFNIDVEDHPEVINCGWCYNWAYAAYSLYGGTLCSTTQHAFVKLNGRYYDAEALEGVEDWRCLPIFKFIVSNTQFDINNFHVVEHSDSKSFWDLWSARGAEPDHQVLDTILPRSESMRSMTVAM